MSYEWQYINGFRNFALLHLLVIKNWIWYEFIFTLYVLSFQVLIESAFSQNQEIVHVVFMIQNHCNHWSQLVVQNSSNENYVHWNMEEQLLKRDNSIRILCYFIFNHVSRILIVLMAENVGSSHLFKWIDHFCKTYTWVWKGWLRTFSVHINFIYSSTCDTILSCAVGKILLVTYWRVLLVELINFTT